MFYWSQDERLEVLKALTHSINMSDDVDLKHLSVTCQHFTGADFKALLYNAQLEAIHDKAGVGDHDGTAGVVVHDDTVGGTTHDDTGAVLGPTEQQEGIYVTICHLKMKLYESRFLHLFYLYMYFILCKLNL